MSMSTKLFEMALMLATNAIDKRTFRKELGKDPLDALEDISHEVGLLAGKCCAGVISDNDSEYVKAREIAIHLTSSLREGAVRSFISETKKGVVNFWLYSLKRKFVPGTSEFEPIADYHYNDRLCEFLKYLLIHDHENLKLYADKVHYFHRNSSWL